jgi:tetratricopeptide (TPR) repeat protein
VGLSLLGGLPGAPGKADARDWDKLYPLACELFKSGTVSEAYQIFKDLEREHAGVLFNLALCHLAADQYERAIGYLDRALSLVKKKPLADRPTLNETYRLLAVRERESGYRLPLPQDAPEYAPGYVRDTIRRLLVDCCAELGLWDRVRTLAEALKPRRYDNVEQALARARQ